MSELQKKILAWLQKYGPTDSFGMGLVEPNGDILEALYDLRKRGLIRMASPDGSTTYFRRRWELTAPEPVPKSPAEREIFFWERVEVKGRGPVYLVNLTKNGLTTIKVGDRVWLGGIERTVKAVEFGDATPFDVGLIFSGS